MPKQAPWPSSAPQPPAVEWDALIAEVVAAGAEVPELDWARPGEDAAAEARAPPVRAPPSAAQRQKAFILQSMQCPVASGAAQVRAS